MDVEILRKVALFEGLTSAQLRKLAAGMKEVSFPINTHIFKEGEPGTGMFIITDGKVRISKMVPGIGEEALAVLRPGAYFGEMEFIDRDLRRAARAIIHERAILYGFAYSALDDLLGTDRDLALAISNAMVKTLASRLRATNDKVTAMFAMASFG